MLKLLVLCLGAVALSQAQPGCPEFGDWLPWTDHCLWVPLANMRKDLAAACKTNITMTRAQEGPVFPLPPGFQVPEKCGHCSFKVRCRKRDKKEGCFSLDPQKEVCHEYGDVCTVGTHPKFGCKWGLVTAALRNCANRPDLADWRRDALQKFSEGLPDMNCMETGGKCKCCCHPYTPNEEGTACVKQDEAQCQAFGPFNEWSQCMWYPIKNIVNDIKTHCQFEMAGELPPKLLPTQKPGMVIPEKCGYCSFKARCRKREKKDGCFSVDAEKKACGPDDCPTCGEICTIDKMDNTCEWGQTLAKGLLTKLDAATMLMPYWRRKGFERMTRHMPYGKCKEVGGKCKCCCHPYEPNEDGTKCVLTPMCSFDPSH